MFLQYHPIALPVLEKHPVSTSLITASGSLTKSLFRHKHTEVVEIRVQWHQFGFPAPILTCVTNSEMQSFALSQQSSVVSVLSCVRLLCVQHSFALQTQGEPNCLWEPSAEGA